MDDGRMTPHRAKPGQKVLGETEARSATKEGVTRYVLIGALALVVIAFAVLYGIYF